MTDKIKSNSDSSDSPESRDLLAELIQKAGRRPEPPRADHDRIFAVASDALHRKREQQSARKNRRYAIAASILLGIVASGFWQFSVMQDPVMLDLERIAGDVEWRKEAGLEWQPVGDSETLIPAGSEFRTAADGVISLRLSNNTSLRIASDTHLQLDSGSEVDLYRGKLYVDSGRNRNGQVLVTTPVGTATDIGTQFEVRYIDDVYRLRVREGQVLLKAKDRELSSTEGEQLQIDSSGTAKRSSVAKDDPDWAWAENIAPVPDFDGERLTVLLSWVSRETGREVVYEDPMLEVRARQTIIHGTIQKLSPLEALEVLLVTTDMRYELSDEGKILIYAKRKT